MKKIFLSAVLSTTLSLTIYANGIAIDGIYYLLDNTNHTATVTYPNETTPSWTGEVSSYTGVINIPSAVSHGGENYVVTGIGNNAFIGSRLTSITLPNTITHIGNSAFCNHRGITTLELPNLQSIGNEAFRWCTSLQKVILPESITSLGITIFQRCLGLTEIQFPQTLTSIPYACLNACSELRSITLPPNITSIPQECFNACVSLQSISLPVGVTNVGLRAFKGTESIEKFFFPKNVSSLGDELFGGYAQDPYTGGAVPHYTGVHKLKYVFIDRATPPTCSGVEKNPFMRVNNSTVKLFVPIGSVEAYKAIPAYADHFEGIYEFGAEASNVMEITDTSALLTWFPDVRVWRYEVKLYKNSILEQQFLVDGNGEIINQQQFAPIYRQKMDTTNSSTDYFVISLGNLTPASEYEYTIEGVDAQNAPIYHSDGSFITTNKQGIEHTSTSEDPRKQTRKILRDGIFYIERNGVLYTVQGAEER